jgi:hypothetical protein
MAHCQQTKATGLCENGVTSSVRAETAAEIAAVRYPALYLAIEHHRNTHGRPMTFTDAPWSHAIYLDQSPNIVIEKSVQCGISEYAVCRAFAGCWKGQAVLYVMPGDVECQREISGRINPVLSNVEFYNQNLGKTDNVRFKELWKGRCYFVGSNTKNSFKSIAIQLLILDEKDECNQANLAFAFDRLAAAKQRTGREPETLEISNPSVGGYGIDAVYSKSDKKVWQLKCPACGQWQPIKWVGNVIRMLDGNQYELIDRAWTAGCGRDIHLGCIRCGVPLDRLARGEWVAEYPDRSISGYHVSQLFTAQTTIEKLWAVWQDSQVSPIRMQRFANSILGEAYSAEGSSITDDMMAACCDQSYFMPETGEGCIAGVDVGGVLHVSISSLKDGKRVKRFIGTLPLTKDWSELDRVLRLYNVFCCVIDKRPEFSAAVAFRDSHPGVVYLCEYPPNPTVRELQVDPVVQDVKIDKHLSLDESYAAYARKMIVLPANYQSIAGFTDQMKAPARMYREFGQSKVIMAVWVEKDGQPDHFRHADNYEYIAQQIAYGNVPRIS